METVEDLKYFLVDQLGWCGVESIAVSKDTTAEEAMVCCSSFISGSMATETL